MISSIITDAWVAVNPNLVVAQGNCESEFSDYEEVTLPESPLAWEFVEDLSTTKQSAKAALANMEEGPTVTDSPNAPKATPPHHVQQKTETSTAQATSAAPVPPHLRPKQASQKPQKVPAQSSKPSTQAKGNQQPGEAKKASRGPQKQGKATAPDHSSSKPDTPAKGNQQPSGEKKASQGQQKQGKGTAPVQSSSKPSTHAKGNQQPSGTKKASRGSQKKGKKAAPAETQEKVACVAAVLPHLRGKSQKQ